MNVHGAARVGPVPNPLPMSPPHPIPLGYPTPVFGAHTAAPNFFYQWTSMWKLVVTSKKSREIFNDI